MPRSKSTPTLDTEDPKEKSRSTAHRHKQKKETDEERAKAEIEYAGEIDHSPCLNCLELGIRCVGMSEGVKCAYCASRGVRCVKSTWKDLDSTRAEKRKAIDDDLDEIERLTARISKNRKILKLAESRAKAKTICLLDELEEKEEWERIENDGFSNAELEALSRDFVQQNNKESTVEGVEIWSAWDKSGVPNGTEQEAGASSAGS